MDSKATLEPILIIASNACDLLIPSQSVNSWIRRVIEEQKKMINACVEVIIHVSNSIGKRCSECPDDRDCVILLNLVNLWRHIKEDKKHREK